MKVRYRSAITGRWVSKQYAEENPHTTIRHEYEKPPYVREVAKQIQKIQDSNN